MMPNLHFENILFTPAEDAFEFELSCKRQYVSLDVNLEQLHWLDSFKIAKLETEMNHLVKTHPIIEICIENWVFEPNFLPIFSISY